MACFCSFHFPLFLPHSCSHCIRAGCLSCYYFHYIGDAFAQKDVTFFRLHRREIERKRMFLCRQTAEPEVRTWRAQKWLIPVGNDADSASRRWAESRKTSHNGLYLRLPNSADVNFWFRLTFLVLGYKREGWCSLTVFLPFHVVAFPRIIIIYSFKCSFCTQKNNLVFNGICKSHLKLTP